MAKKNIISDFGALKGKITFSEGAAVEKPKVEKDAAGQKKEVPAKKEEDGALKVGQKVVLMDSDLRGKIVSIGRTVGIELEELLHAGNFLLLLADVIDVVEVTDFKLQRVGYISVAGAVR